MNDIAHDDCLAAASSSSAELFAKLDYRAGAHVFSSPEGSIIAHGKAHSLQLPLQQPELAQRASAMLAQAHADGMSAPVLMGALPFAEGNSDLFIPNTVQRQLGHHFGALQTCATLTAPQKQLARPAIAFLPDAQRYRANVAHALRQFASGSLDKVVLARALKIQTKTDIAQLLANLQRQNQRAYTFAIGLGSSQASGMQQQGGFASLVGASPELLLEKRGEQVFSHPLAGSIARSADPQEDGRRAENLLRSSKDLREHALVVDAVKSRLQGFCKQLHVPAKPSLLATPTMWHLGTPIRGVLRDAGCDSLQIALALHPTPAVCGHPALAARDFIAEVEGFDRAYFAGMLGWRDLAGDGEWAVSLRCAQIEDESATLYAGAGVVAGSEPELEWQETCAKLRTMLLAMDLPGDLAQELLSDTAQEDKREAA